MKYKDILEQELKKMGFAKIYYDVISYNKVADALSLIGSDFYSQKEIDAMLVELDKGRFCLVQNIILDKKVISANVSFMCTEDNGEEIMNNLYESQLNTQITPINEKFDSVMVSFVYGRELKDDKEDIAMVNFVESEKKNDK